MAIGAYTRAVLASGPVVYWPMNDYGLAQDASGNGLHMTTGGTASNRATVVSPALGFRSSIFNGGEIGSRAAVSTQQDNFTMEMWFRPEIIGGNNQIFFGNVNGNTQGWTADISTNGIIRGVAQGVAVLGNTNGAMSTGNWYHLVITRRSGTWMYFINGAVDNTNAGTGTPNTPPSVFHIHSGSSLQAYYSNVAYYNVALTNSEIRSHYLAAFQADDDAAALGLKAVTVA